MKSDPDIPIPCRIIALMQERNRLFEYPLHDLEAAIRAYGFRCTRCGRCCTRPVNGHVFLLDRDAEKAREIDPGSLEPAPNPEFCDQNGTLYVSGYALKMRADEPGSCWFLQDRLCRIYDRRFSVCRMYPHMLRPVLDPKGKVVWRHFARENEHGEYNCPVPEKECRDLARRIREYENAFLTQQISFLETLHEYFSVMGLVHDRRMHDRRMREVLHGAPATVMVYCAGELEEHRVTVPGSSKE